jgi:hypothetical protein
VTRARHACIGAVLGALVVGSTPAARQVVPAPPVVGVFYRGTPAGVPVQDELALVRALGFGAVVWPFDDPARARELARMTGLVGLRVLSPRDAERDDRRSRIMPVPAGEAPGLPALAWLAIAAGARTLLLDAGTPTGAGFQDGAGRPAPWLQDAQALARQIDANAELIGRLAQGPSIDVDAGGTRVVLLDGGRAWVLIAANPSPAPQAALARVPNDVPFGPWVSLIDGTDMAMIVRRGYHEYRAALAAGEARVYVIDKTPPATS